VAAPHTARDGLRTRTEQTQRPWRPALGYQSLLLEAVAGEVPTQLESFLERAQKRATRFTRSDRARDPGAELPRVEQIVGALVARGHRPRALDMADFPARLR
jgi:hypothetical protein